MWRCHCGELNLESAVGCRACRGGRTTHEDHDAEPPVPERDRIVYMGMLGMGLGPPRDRDEELRSRRSLTEAELNAYYARARRARLWSWLLSALVAVAALGLLAWQILRRE